MAEIQWQIDLAAAFIAVTALVISVYFGWRQSNIELESLREQRDSDIISWSNDAIEACCRAEMVLRPLYARVTSEDEFERCKLETLATLSSVIDRGRLYFPNIEDGEYGVDKEAAFRGHRHAVLDQLIGVYDLLESASHDVSDEAARAEMRETSIRFKREFVSTVQSEVDPKRRVHFLARSARKMNKGQG